MCPLSPDVDPVRPDYLRGYLGVLGAALLLQGSTSLLLHEALTVGLSWSHGFLTTDDRHAALHVAWGLGMLAALAVRSADRSLIRLGLVFGAFYLALAILGIVVDHPFGLRLGVGENVFHAIIGPLALVLALSQARAPEGPEGVALPDAK
jgi:hypothetical protein